MTAPMTAPMTRKAFCGALAGSTVVLLFQGCGGGGDTAAPAPAPGGAGCVDTIANNHPTPHALVVAKADLDSLTDKTYDIQGAAAHTHSVTFSVAQLRTLKTGTAVTVTSSMGAGHDHTVTATCT